MGDCERVAKCTFFMEKMPNMPEAAKTIKQYYCRKNYVRCARFVCYKVSCECPSSLLPHDFEYVVNRFGWNIHSEDEVA